MKGMKKQKGSMKAVRSMAQLRAPRGAAKNAKANFRGMSLR